MAARRELAPEEWPPEGGLSFLPTKATAAEPWSRAVAARFRQRPPAPPAPPLPEAPVSITLKASLHGHEVLVTLRGVDFASVRAPVEAASQWLRSQTPPPASSQDEGWCSLHQVQMHRNEKQGRSWWSHKTDQGWCKGKGR